MDSFCNPLFKCDQANIVYQLLVIFWLMMTAFYMIYRYHAAEQRTISLGYMFATLVALKIGMGHEYSNNVAAMAQVVFIIYTFNCATFARVVFKTKHSNTISETSPLLSDDDQQQQTSLEFILGQLRRSLSTEENEERMRVLRDGAVFVTLFLVSALVQYLFS
ncbi:hypothetical protein BC829DRAFT_175369 [Chytridium lagenaria]|nr:hypothetical protein BC829DRAFT_175369 [Chytridium lagenaria]